MDANRKKIDEVRRQEETDLEEKLKELFKKYPKPDSEMNIWKIMESVGGYIFYTEHDIADGRMESSPATEKHLKLSREVSEMLVKKLKDFGVIPPNECPVREIGKKLPPAPKGKIYYWDWYEKKNQEYYTEVYEGIICSACPLAEENPVKIIQRSIPCSVFPGIAYQLFEPHRCAMLDMYDWKEEKLYQEIRKNGGEDILKRFKQKFWMLKKQNG